MKHLYMVANEHNLTLTSDKKYWSDPTSCFHSPAKLPKKVAIKLKTRLEDEDSNLHLKLGVVK